VSIPPFSPSRILLALTCLAAASLLQSCASAPAGKPGSPLVKRDKSGATDLIRASKKADTERMRQLLDGGANPNDSDNRNFTALEYLVDDDRYHNDAVELLLRCHANPNLADENSNTALILAASKDCGEANEADQERLLTLLLNAGADPKFASSQGLYPLQLAASHGQPGPCIDLLARSTGEKEQIDLHGYSALSEAALADQRATESHLLAEGQVPQNIRPADPDPTRWPPAVDDGFAITARVWDAYGDYLGAAGRIAQAQEAFKRSQDSNVMAIAEYTVALERYSKALKDEKAKRFNKVMGTVALNVLGVGLGVVTGVGVGFIPKKGTFQNNVDEYDDMVDHFKDAIALLQREKASVAAKLATSPGPTH
jgi:tetratricopeptide (TPR) repeat protein